MSEAIHANLEKVSQFARREDAKRTASQRAIERVSVFFGEPRFLLTFLCASVAWIVSDVFLHHMGYRYFDEPPFSLLQGIVTFVGVLITMAVLIRQPLNICARANVSQPLKLSNCPLTGAEEVRACLSQGCKPAAAVLEYER
ncbi:DUF1003 domain-containing protein [Caballeronia sp. SBC2]|uniref:DUF1003 domain-containing protein n=1 Tax=Caballeronia sp. SBC2 TaxID=2705547 RepID=UPI0013E134CF|nr:DUF1003 domain-containing protein [Caballeronia sp. SBC2]QIE29620.1 hypothetical protein SBC2_76960 [Caballeronia sp. SBC2]